MPQRKSLRNRRQRRKVNREFELTLTSMIDIMVVVLVFLLKSYATSMNAYSEVPGIKLPESMGKKAPQDALSLVIKPEAIVFEHQRVVEFKKSPNSISNQEPKYQFQQNDLSEGGLKIIPLYEALIQKKEQSEIIQARYEGTEKTNQKLRFDGVLAIQADKKIQYNTLRKIMYTAGDAGYEVFRLLASEDSGSNE